MTPFEINYYEIDDVFQETLELLEWPTLCSHISTFAVTHKGQSQCKDLPIPGNIESSRKKLQQVLEISYLDEIIEGGINFQGVFDLEKILFLCSKGGICSGEELLKVAQTLRTARKLRQQIYNISERPMTSDLISNLATLPELQQLLEFGLEEGGRVADRASRQLSDLRRDWNKLRLERRDILLDFIRKHNGSLQDNTISERHGRTVLSVKVGVADQFQGIVHDSSSSGNTIFFEPQSVVKIGNKIAEIRSQITNEEQRLLGIWSNQVGENFLAIEHLSDVMLQLELILARSRYSKWIGGLPPLLYEEDTESFSIKDFLHPLLIWQERNEKGSKVVPITFDVSSELKVVAITGPNTGGKTVALKSFGLAVLMAKSGIFLPCSSQPSLPWCSHVFADIGDEQSLQQNLSTFSGHICRITRILSAIDKSPGINVVLLDEIGAGTDPTEGTALAIAILRSMADKARLTIATTHFGELKALKYSDPRFENASVAFDSETLTPTYDLQWGIPGRSNALEIARRLGVEDQVIDFAKELVIPKGVDDVNQVIRGLEEQRNRQQSAAEDAAALLARTEILHEELLMSWEKQQKESLQLKKRGRQELETSIREGQKEVRSLISRLRNQNANGEIARRAGIRLREIDSNHRPEQIRRYSLQGWSPKVGDRVRLTSIGKAGEVISVSEDGSCLTVLCGVFRSTVTLNDVESLDGQKPRAIKNVVKVHSSSIPNSHFKVRTKKNTIDVRGLRVHEAESVIEEKLRNWSGPLWVIHGIGSGKLKRGLREWLETVPYVEKVTDADVSDGGTGCSVIWII